MAKLGRPPKGHEKRNHTIRLRVDVSDALRQAARETDTEMSEIVERGLRRELKLEAKTE